VPAEKADLAQALPGLSDQRGGRRPLVLLIKAADLLAKVRYRHQIGTCRVGQGIAEPFFSLSTRSPLCRAIAVLSAVRRPAGAREGTVSRRRPGWCPPGRPTSTRRGAAGRAASRWRDQGVGGESVTGAEQPVQARGDPGGQGLAPVSGVGQVALAASCLAGRCGQGDAALGQEAAQFAAEVSHRSSPITGARSVSLFPG